MWQEVGSHAVNCSVQVLGALPDKVKYSSVLKQLPAERVCRNELVRREGDLTVAIEFELWLVLGEMKRGEVVVLAGYSLPPVLANLAHDEERVGGRVREDRVDQMGEEASVYHIRS